MLKAVDVYAVISLHLKQYVQFNTITGEEVGLLVGKDYIAQNHLTYDH